MGGGANESPKRGRRNNNSWGENKTGSGWNAPQQCVYVPAQPAPQWMTPQPVQVQPQSWQAPAQVYNQQPPATPPKADAPKSIDDLIAMQRNQMKEMQRLQQEQLQQFQNMQS